MRPSGRSRSGAGRWRPGPSSANRSSSEIRSNSGWRALSSEIAHNALAAKRQRVQPSTPRADARSSPRIFKKEKIMFKKFSAILLLTLCAAGATLAQQRNQANAQTQSSDVINACYQTNNGQLRRVASLSECKATET